MIEPIQVIGDALWFILPAYIANGTPVVLGGGPPIDGGKGLSDGYRIFGDGKTIRGFLFGILAGSVFGLIQNTIWSRPGGLLAVILLALGALFGDLAGSFIKRRRGIRSGGPLFGLDQLGFVVVALLAVSLVVVPEWRIVATLLVLTPFIHWGANIFGYKLGLKSEPY